MEPAPRAASNGGQAAGFVVTPVQESANPRVSDLNWFKQINDAFGHAAGDAVIRATGQRFGEWAEDNAGVAGRLGGDEFAAVTTVRAGIGTVTGSLLVQLADLLDRLEQPVDFEGQRIDVYASIGAALCWRSGEADLSALLRRADEQMYRTKQEGGGWSIAPALGSATAVRTVNGRREGRPGTTGGTGAAA